MEKWKRDHIINNLPILYSSTNCTDELMEHMRHWKVLTEADINLLETINDSRGKSSQLYSFVLTKENSYEYLTKSLFDCRQAEASLILLNGLAEQGINDPMKHCNIQTNYDAILNARSLFQGRTRSLREIFKHFSVDDVKEIMKTGDFCRDYINVLMNQEITLVKESIPKKPDYYQNRALFQRFHVDPKLFKENDTDVFVFTGISRLHLRDIAQLNPSAVSSSQIVERTSRFILLESYFDWEEIRDKADVPVHLLRPAEGNPHTFTLEETHENTEDNANQSNFYITEGQFLQENMKNNTTGILICDTPGMGKSHFLANLARETAKKYPNKIVAFVTLPHFFKTFLRSTKPYHKPSDVDALTVFAKYISTSPFTAAILRRAIEKHYIQLEIFFDALDELPAEEIEWTIRFVKKLQKTSKASIYMTSGLQLQGDLERSLNFTTYHLRTFSVPDYVRYMEEYWKVTLSHGGKNKFNKASLRDFAERLVSRFRRSLTNHKMDTLGSPLLVYLLSKAFTPEAKLIADNHKQIEECIPTIISLFDVYKKMDESNTKRPNDDRLKQSNYAFFEAFHLLFPDSLLEWTITPYNMAGEEEKISSDHEFFFHRTVAEFKAATFIGMLLSEGSESHYHYMTNLNLTTEILHCLLRNVFSVTPSGHELEWENPWQSEYPRYPSVHLYTFTNPILVYFFNAHLNDLQSVDVPQIAIDTFATLFQPYHFYQILQSAIFHNHIHLVRFLGKILQGMIHSTKEPYEEYFIQNISQFEDQAQKESVNRSYWLLCIAASFTDFSMVKEISKFFENCFKYNLRIACMDIPFGMKTPLHWAVSKGDLKTVRYLYNFTDLTGKQLLYYCLEGSYGEPIELIKKKIKICELLLLVNRSLISECGHFNWCEYSSPIVADRYGAIHFLLVKFLVDNGANILSTKDDCVQRQTLLTISARWMSSEHFEMLVDFLVRQENGAKLFIADREKSYFPIHEILSQRNLLHALTFKKMIDISGVNTSTLDENGNGFIVRAYLGGQSELILNSLFELVGGYNRTKECILHSMESPRLKCLPTENCLHSLLLPTPKNSLINSTCSKEGEYRCIGVNKLFFVKISEQELIQISETSNTDGQTHNSKFNKQYLSLNSEFNTVI